LLAAIKPRWAVLSTGKNSFGHPTTAAISRLENAGASIWYTDANGTITADFDGTSPISWHADKQAKPRWDASTQYRDRQVRGQATWPGSARQPVRRGGPYRS